jgi:His/Glu/Gln/Arg/opine family amino acid ABC transporter permease subunit
MNAVLRALIQASPALGFATLMTLGCAIAAGIIALIIGIPAGFARLSPNVFVRSVATSYVEAIRGTPLLLQLLVWSFGVSILVGTLFNFHVIPFVYTLLTRLNSNTLFTPFINAGGANIFFGVIGLGVNYGAYIAEVVRGGVQAVDRGETEAALSLGLSGLQTARYVVLPQALRLMTPALTNNLITLIQDTSFLQIIAVAELSLVVFSDTQGISISAIGVRWGFYTVELLLYFSMCYSLALVSRWLEQRTAHTLAGAH